MEEKYLQNLWKHKSIPVVNQMLTNGDKVTVLDYGRFNTGEGPDFLYAKVDINGIIFFGHIEIHLKSSDWYRHKHQFDANYNTVVLHVVYEHDKKIVQNDFVLPTLELKSFFSKNRDVFSWDNIPCKNFISEIDSIYIESIKHKALLRKLNCKKDSLLINDVSLLRNENFLSICCCKMGFVCSSSTTSSKASITVLPVTNMAFSSIPSSNRFCLERSVGAK